jgi:hypothetical protein
MEVTLVLGGTMRYADNPRRPTHAICWAAALAAALAPATAQAQAGGDGKAGKKKPPGPVEVRFVDDSTMRVQLQDERIELETPHGKLLIPAADIHHIELAWRAPEDVAKRAAAAVADLGHKDFKRRQTATEELAALGEQALPFLLKAVESKDAEAARRVRDLLEKLRQTVPADRWEPRQHDVVVTEHSRYTGRLSVAALKVKTFQFGEQPLKLCDVRGLRFPGAPVEVRAMSSPPTVTPGVQINLPSVIPPPPQPALPR